MHDEITHKTEPLAGENSQDKKPAKAHKNKDFSRKSLKYSTGIIAFGTLGLIGAWVMRQNIAKTSIESYLKTKGIDAVIELEQLQLDKAKFKNLVLSKSGKQTININNGVLRWHIGKKNQFIIDEISANSAFFNFGINNNKIDFGALTPFLKNNGKKNETSIGKIEIDNLTLKLESPIDVFTFKGKVSGNGAKSISAGLILSAPNKFANKPIILGGSIGALNQANNKIGLKIITQNNDLSVTNNLVIKKTNANIWGEIEVSKSNPIRINLLTSSLNFADLINNNLAIKNADLIFERGFLETKGEIYEDIIFTFDGKAKANNLKFANNNINKIDFDFAAARAKNHQMRIATIGKVANADFQTKIGNSNFDAIFDVKSSNLSKILDDPFSAKINFILRKIENPILSKAIANLPSNSFDSLLKSPNLELKAQVNGKFENFDITPNGPIKVFANTGEIIEFENQFPTSVLNFQTLKGHNQTKLIAKGKIKGSGKNGMSLNTNLDGFQFDESGIGIIFNKFLIKNGVFGNKTFDLNIANGRFSQSKDKKTNGNVIGKITGNSADFFGASTFDISINNNILALKADGNFRDFNLENAKTKNLIFQISSNGDIKSKLNLIGNTSFSQLQINNNQINNGKTQFSAKILPDQSIAIGEIKGGFYNIKSNNLKSNNFEFSTNGNLNFKNDIKYLGKLYANASNFNINENHFQSPKIDGEFDAFFTKQGFSINSNKLFASIKNFENKDLSLQNLRIIGPLGVSQNTKNLEIKSSKCFSILFDNLKSGNNIMGQTDGQTCPDNFGRLVTIYKDSVKIFAQTNIGATSFKLGEGENAPSLNIAKLKGGFVPNSNGKNIFKGFADGLNLKFSTAPNEWALLSAKNTDLVLDYGKNGTKINAKIANFSSDGLPVEIIGALNGQIDIINGKSPYAEFDLSNIIINDKAKLPRFATFELNGRGELLNQKLTIFGDANLNKNKKNIAQIYLDHNLNTGNGSVLIDASKLEFSPKRPINLDFDDIIPASQGVFVNSIGPMAAIAKIEWSPDKELQSSAKIETKNFGFDGTLVSMSGIDGEIIISDLFKLKTPSQQNIRIKEMNPGIPIINGKLGFELKGDNAIDLNEISWSLADGILELKPVKIPFATGPQQLEIIASKIDIEKLLKLAKIPNIEVEGKMSGVLPVFIKDNSFEIIGGKLIADGAGVLRYTGPSFGGEKAQPKGWEKLKFKLVGGPPKGGAELAFDALKDLRFKILEIAVDGRLTGQMQFKILIEGSNPDLLNGQVFRFNIKLDLPLGEIISRYQSIFNPRFEYEKPL